MFSIYTSAFNLIQNRFDYKTSIHNFSMFADEVVVALNTSVDDSEEHLRDFIAENCNNVRILKTNISYDDPLLDGKIKNAALQSTTQQIKIGLDMDEYIPMWQKSIWINVAEQLAFSYAQSVMIPSVNLYKEIESYFSITPKWYMHKAGLYRGAVNFARNSNGTVDTAKSDTCELIDARGNLVSSLSSPVSINDLRNGNCPFVVHTGYLDLGGRVDRNRNFWKKHWEVESGGCPPKHKVHESLEDFNEWNAKHGLNI